jgi:acyl-CoA synthetase (NDP forming)
VNFQALFEPKTMAVIGVSLNNDRHPANVIYYKNNLRYPVKVFPVNPRGGVVQGERVFAHISEIPEKVDLAVIAVRAEHVSAILSDCIQGGVGAAAVISGGFAESGRADLQDRIVAIAREADFPFVGPNCLGIYSPTHMDTFFLPSERMVRPDPGNVALVSQSGGILVDQMIKFAEEGVGLSRAVSIGNKALVKELELLGYLAQDPETKVIAFYVEGFGKNEGRDFLLATSQCQKPVIVLKAGKSPGGSRAVSSHTASLAGDYETFSAVFSQYDGVVEAKNELEMVTFCESLSCYQRSIEGKVGIVTGSAVDDDFVFATSYLSRRPEIDCIIILLLPYLPGITSDLGARLSQVYYQERKPLVAYVPHVEKYRMLIEGFELSRIPVSPSIEGAVLLAEAMRRAKPC